MLEYFDEGGEKIRDPFTQLLNVGMLIGRAFVALDGNPLVHDVPLEVFLFAQ